MKVDLDPAMQGAVTVEGPPGVDAKRAEIVGPSIDRRYVTAALMLVMVLASMEQTITSTAMPTIIGELHGLEHYSWVASIYLLACTVSMPLYGRLADALGRKRVVLAAIGLFLLSSVLAASARTMLQLVLYRGLQGLGAGGIMPVVLTILGDIFTLKERARIQGAFSAVWGTAALAGPALGAWMVKFLGWRSIFFVNLPLGAIGLAVLMWKYHDHEKPHSTDLDLPGIGGLAVACLCTLAVVSRLGPGGWPWPIAAALVALALGAGIFFIWHERRAGNPVMPPQLMLQRNIGPSMVCSLLLGVGIFATETYVPLYMQGGRGGDATAAANVITPVMLTWAMGGLIAANLIVRWGFRKTALLGASLIVTSFTGLVICVAVEARPWIITAVLALTGLGFGPASMSYLLAAQGSVAWQQRGIVTSSVTFFRTVGGAVGIGLLGALFNIMISRRLASIRGLGLTPASVLDPKRHHELPPDVLVLVQKMISSGLLWVFVAMAVLAVIQLAMTLLMSRRVGRGKVAHGKAMEIGEVLGAES